MSFGDDLDSDAPVLSGADLSKRDQSAIINKMRDSIVSSVQRQLKLINDHAFCSVSNKRKEKGAIMVFNDTPAEKPGLYLFNQDDYEKLLAMVKTKGKLEEFKEAQGALANDLAESISPDKHGNPKLVNDRKVGVYLMFKFKVPDLCRYWIKKTSRKTVGKLLKSKNPPEFENKTTEDGIFKEHQRVIIENDIKKPLLKFKRFIQNLAYSKDAAPAQKPETSVKTPAAPKAEPKKEEPKKEEPKQQSAEVIAWKQKQMVAIADASSTPAKPKGYPNDYEALKAFLKNKGLFGTLPAPAQKESLTPIQKYIIKEQDAPAPAPQDTAPEQPITDEQLIAAIKKLQTSLKLKPTGVYDVATHKAWKAKDFAPPPAAPAAEPAEKTAPTAEPAASPETYDGRDLATSLMKKITSKKEKEAKVQIESLKPGILAKFKKWFESEAGSAYLTMTDSRVKSLKAMVDAAASATPAEPAAAPAAEPAAASAAPKADGASKAVNEAFIKKFLDLHIKASTTRAQYQGLKNSAADEDLTTAASREFHKLVAEIVKMQEKLEPLKESDPFAQAYFSQSLPNNHTDVSHAYVQWMTQTTKSIKGMNLLDLKKVKLN